MSAMVLPFAREQSARCPQPPLPLELDGVGFELNGERLLHNISVRIDGFARTVVLGPNGAGKSLLLRLAHGLIRPTRGQVRWAETDAVALRRAQAFVFQRPVLLRRSACADIEHALAAHGVPRGERRARAFDALDYVGLRRLADRPARVLSGGEQQRLALARAWSLRPRVLFLDEPTASLDPAATRRVECVIRRMHDAGVAIVMTTHDLGQARRLADEILFLHKGRLLERTGAGQFFTRPESSEARAFLAGDLLD